MSKIYLTNLDSDVTGYKLALVDQRNPFSTALATSVTTTTSSGDDIVVTATEGGTELKWITKPFLADVAFAAEPWFYNIWAKESNAAANATAGFTLAEYTTSAQAAFLDKDHGTEAATTIARLNGISGNATATTIDAGNRLIIGLEAVAVGTMGASQTLTIDFDGPTAGADGDTYVQCNETIRLAERQLKNGTYPVLPGAGVGFYENIIDGLNGAIAGKVVSQEPALTILLDELAFERDNL